MELSFKKIALTLPHSTGNAEKNSMFWSITWQQEKMYDIPHQVSSNPVSCVKSSLTRSERKVYMDKAGAVPFSAAYRTQKLYQFWNQENYFFYIVF